MRSWDRGRGCARAWLALIGGSVWLTGMASAPPVAGEDPFAAHVRPTGPLTPREQLEAFQLPAGFEMQLVAAEPDILKPLNMAFDPAGRLWVTSTIEYPHAAPLDRPGRDRISILEDTDGDGRADKIITFAEGLNIPIGIYPYRGGAIVFSIPHIYHLRDHDGDGRADEREILYGPLGYKDDTHGLNNAFRRGFDGWLYACHGFRNTTTIRGRDGSEIHLNSGNTYRVRLDGSRVEQFTWGQVNPFGMALDEQGNLYTADCHSSPVYQLLRGGYYPSFGKPHDGIGFVPPIMQHQHGSTALCGVVYYDGGDFPREYHDNLFIGNVMTSRVNRDTLDRHGATLEAHETTDLVRTTDPWFRPVDLQLGPDGAIYIADFYNKIIGHYEVRLDHPGRDRHRGRIWRLVYRGTDGKPPSLPPSLAEAAPERLIEALAHGNLTYRNLALNEIVDRHGKAAIPPLTAALRAAAASVRSRALWALHRLGAAAPAAVAAAARDDDDGVRQHAMRVLSETASWTDEHRRLAVAGLRDQAPAVRRAAADALAQQPHPENIRPLLEGLGEASGDDVYLRHGLLIALRNQLRPAGVLATLEAESRLSGADTWTIAPLLLSIEGSEAGSFLLRFVEQHDVERGRVEEFLQHAARHVPPPEIRKLAVIARERFRGDLQSQLALFRAVEKGLAQRGLQPDSNRDISSLSRWGKDLALSLLDASPDTSWSNHPLPGSTPSDDPWVVEQRRSADGDTRSDFLSSLPRGERLTGVLRSQLFVIPSALRFYLAGHAGAPDRPPAPTNFVRLRDSASGAIVAQCMPPRNDVAQRIDWDLGEHAGRKGYLEVVDGDDGGAYAWLAVGRFQPPVVEVPPAETMTATRRRRAAVEIIADLGFRDLKPKLEKIVLDETEAPETRKAAANALLALDADPELSALVAVGFGSGAPAGLPLSVSRALVERRSGAASELLVEAVRTTPGRLQVILAQALASTPRGAETLLDLVGKGQASARLLRGSSVREKILAVEIPDAARRIDALTADLPAANDMAQKLVAERLKAFSRHRPDPSNGAAVFEKSCANCHQIGDKGSLIGPQLHGIGNRGLERIVEDVLDPNRNVDRAFRASTIVVTDGTVISGLYRRDEGETVVVADATGKEISIPRQRIVKRVVGEASLMPDNFGDSLSEKDFHDLLAYLLAQREGTGKESEQ